MCVKKNVIEIRDHELKEHWKWDKTMHKNMSKNIYQFPINNYSYNVLHFKIYS